MPTHGAASTTFTNAHDVTASRRNLDISGLRSSEFGSSGSTTTAKFVKPPFLPSGFSQEARLHANTCAFGGLEYSLTDPARWSSRAGIGQARTFGQPANAFSGRVAQHVPTGYTRTSVAIFGGARAFPATSSVDAPAAAPLGLGGTMRHLLPSGYSLNRKLSYLDENWLEVDATQRFAAPPTTLPRADGGGDVLPAQISAYTRSLASTARAPIAPSAVAPLALHPTQARLRALNSPFDFDPHAHKRR